MEPWPRVHQQDGLDKVTEPQAPQSRASASLVQGIAALWEECLNGCEVGADDDFFALGGNSLIGIRIIDRMSQDYGVELSVRAFYLAQTPARVAELIAQERALP